MSDHEELNAGRHLGKVLLTAGAVLLLLAFLVPNGERPEPVGGPLPPVDEDPLEGAWLSTPEEAYALPEAADKPVFILFTGSTWCEPCIILRRDIYTRPEFADFAKEELILVKIDAPSSGPTTNQVALMEKYLVRGFPTAIVEKDGKEAFRWVGLKHRKPETMISALKTLLPPTDSAKSGSTRKE